MEFITKSASETKEVGRKVAAFIRKAPANVGGVVLALSGNLGSGKTTFTQGLAENFGIEQRIVSPTFILMRQYDIPQKKGARFGKLYHIDLYRLESAIEEELVNLGLQEIWADPQNIVLIEWAEKARDIVPTGAYWLRFDNLGDDRRKIALKL